jgi:hypothetical protein
LSGLTSNPRFHEMMMGWPIGWTASGESVTEFPAWLRRSRGQFSRLLMAFDPEGDNLVEGHVGSVHLKPKSRSDRAVPE